MNSEGFPVFQPNLQISFYNRLKAIKSFYLQDALKIALNKVKIQELDGELNNYVNERYLRKMAQFHIRGEVFFPVPCLIKAYPYLLGYYRLLNGLSQKEFYGRSPYGRFKKLEESGYIPDSLSAEDIDKLCRSLIATAELLVDGLDSITIDLASHLQLLTLGAQLRGSYNNRIGEDATLDVVGLIRSITSKYIQQDEGNKIILVNDSGNIITIDFLSDPDVRILGQLDCEVRPILSIEIKGGRDISNVHNRMGEAEKSHQKAKEYGFREFWTLVRADIDMDMARKESPTTNHFFKINEILDMTTQEHRKFKELLCSFIGIKSKDS